MGNSEQEHVQTRHVVDIVTRTGKFMATKITLDFAMARPVDADAMHADLILRGWGLYYSGSIKWMGNGTMAISMGESHMSIYARRLTSSDGNGTDINDLNWLDLYRFWHTINYYEGVTPCLPTKKS